MGNKVFDILINSKYQPEGTAKFLGSLKSIGELGQVVRFGLVQPLEQAGRVMLDFIQAANPERVEHLNNAFQNLKVGVGSVIDQIGGSLIDALADTIDKATILQSIALQLKNDGTYTNAKSGEDVTNAAMAKTRAAFDQIGMYQGIRDQAAAGSKYAQKSLDDLWADYSVEVVDGAKKTSDFNAVLMRSSATWGQYLDNLKLNGVEVKNLADEFKKFSALNNLKAPDIMGAGAAIGPTLAAINQKITDAQADQAKARKNLLVDIAISEARRLEDVARQNQRTLVSIDAQRVDAIATADATLAATLAQIAQDSADQRAQIERSYQDQIRQIKQSSGEGIEDAIERRDARALSKALASRDQQLADAKRNHDQQLADQAKAEEKSKAQAQAAHDQAIEQAKAAAQAAIEVLKEQNAQAAEDARIAQQRQRQDFDLANGRRLQDMAAQGRKEAEQALANFKTIQTSYANFINNLETQTRNAGTTTSPLMVAIKNFVTDLVGDLMGNGRTYYTGGA